MAKKWLLVFSRLRPHCGEVGLVYKMFFKKFQKKIL